MCPCSSDQTGNFRIRGALLVCVGGGECYLLTLHVCCSRCCLLRRGKSYASVLALKPFPTCRSSAGVTPCMHPPLIMLCLSACPPESLLSCFPVSLSFCLPPCLSLCPSACLYWFACSSSSFYSLPHPVMSLRPFILISLISVITRPVFYHVFSCMLLPFFSCFPVFILLFSFFLFSSLPFIYHLSPCVFLSSSSSSPLV